jgi:secreted trypsin-like serine protease
MRERAARSTSSRMRNADLLKLSLSFLAAAFAGCSAHVDDGVQSASSDIIGGDVITADNPDGETFALISLNDQTFCSGAFIDASWVLTAAHCVYGIPQSGYSSLYVTPFSDASRGGPVDDIRINDWYIDSMPAPNRADVALVHLSRPAYFPHHPNFRQRIYSDSNASLVGTTLDCYGNGKVVDGSDPESWSEAALRHALLPVTGSNHLDYTLGKSASGQGVTLGDSGGPCFVTMPNGVRALTGVHAYRDFNPGSGTTSGSGDVGAEFFASWVNSIVPNPIFAHHPPIPWHPPTL